MYNLTRRSGRFPNRVDGNMGRASQPGLAHRALAQSSWREKPAKPVKAHTIGMIADFIRSIVRPVHVFTDLCFHTMIILDCAAYI
jgi:hypothetical protein